MDVFKIKNRKFPKNFNIVSRFIKNKKGITVKLGEKTQFLGPYEREILIHHNYDLRQNGLFMLLFECGKSLQPQNPLQQDLRKKPNVSQIRYEQDLSDLDAWNRGEEIIKELKLNVNISDYLNFKRAYLLKYFQ